jgi:hypothetical protein
LTDAVHALLTWIVTTGRGHAADAADVLQQAACATAAGTLLAGGAAFVTLEAGALDRAAGIARTADFALRAADALAGAELLGQTAQAVSRHAHGPAQAGAIDLAAATILDDLAAFPLTELTPGFRTALRVLPLPVTIPVAIVVIAIVVITIVVIAIVVMTSPASAIASTTISATADEGPIAVAAGAPRNRQDGDRGGVAEYGRDRGNETAQRQPARDAGA